MSMHTRTQKAPSRQAQRAKQRKQSSKRPDDDATPLAVDRPKKTHTGRTDLTKSSTGSVGDPDVTSTSTTTTTTPPLLDPKAAEEKILELTTITGLSGFMLMNVFSVLQSNSRRTGMHVNKTKGHISPIMLQDGGGVIFPNPNVRSMGREEIEKHRDEYILKKQTANAMKKAATPALLAQQAGLSSMSNRPTLGDTMDDDEQVAADDELAGDSESEDEEASRGGNRQQRSAAVTKTPNQSKRLYTDDMIRKYILEKREKELSNRKVLLAGTADQYEKITVEQKDEAMVWEFLGTAKTIWGWIYIYYIGPSDKGLDNVELSKAENWYIPHKTHQIHFHRRITTNMFSRYLKHCSTDQVEKNGNEMVQYDPRFIVFKWLDSKAGKEKKPLLFEHQQFFQLYQDYLVREWETRRQHGGSACKEPYYYQEPLEYLQHSPGSAADGHRDACSDRGASNASCPANPSPLFTAVEDNYGRRVPRHTGPPTQVSEPPVATQTACTKETPSAPEKTKKRELPVFDVEADRLQQMRRGYEILDDEYRQVNAEQFELQLPLFPLPRNMAFDFERFRQMIQCAHVSATNPKHPSFYNQDPMDKIEAAMIALNPTLYAQTCLSSIFDDHVKIRDRDNMLPIIDFVYNDPECQQRLKEAAQTLCLSLMGVELITRERSYEVQLAFARNQQNTFELLED